MGTPGQSTFTEAEEFAFQPGDVWHTLHSIEHCLGGPEFAPVLGQHSMRKDSHCNECDNDEYGGHSKRSYSGV